MKQWVKCVLRPAFLGFLAVAGFVCSPLCSSKADAQGLPHFFDSQERLDRPDLSDMKRLRFLTTVDFPPFNMIDQTGRLSGYNIDLLRAICAELKLSNICQVEALPWGELVSSIEQENGEAIIAGLNESNETKNSMLFSRAYLKFPARFMALNDVTLAEPINTDLARLKTGLIQNSAHLALFQHYFPKAKFVVFENNDALYHALKDKTIDLAFGDGMAFSIYLNDEKSKNCCHLVGGPYMAPQYLGEGMRIAVSKNNPKLLRALNYAMKSLERKGKLNELYLRYFPIGFY